MAILWGRQYRKQLRAIRACYCANNGTNREQARSYQYIWITAVNDDDFARLRALNPDIVDAAKALATAMVASMPHDLEAAEEPAHVYRAASPSANDPESRT